MTGTLAEGKIDLGSRLSIHIVGIGGAGMRAIALVLSSMGHSVIFLEVVEVKQGTGGSVVAICATILKLLWRKVPGGFPKRSNLKSSSVVNPAEDRGPRGQGELRPAPLVRGLELWSREWRGLVESSGSKWFARTAMGQAR